MNGKDISDALYHATRILVHAGATSAPITLSPDAYAKYTAYLREQEVYSGSGPPPTETEVRVLSEWFARWGVYQEAP